jgi:hypothetical protein
MPEPAAIASGSSPKKAIRIRFIHEVDEYVTRHPVKYANATETEAPSGYYREQRLPPTNGGKDMPATGGHGGGHSTGGGATFAAWIVGAIVVLLLLYGFKHFVNGEPLLGVNDGRHQQSDNVQPPSAPPPSSAPVASRWLPRTPTPEEAFSRATHHQTRQCVACVSGYEQDPATCECTQTTWHPGSPPDE